MFALSLPKKVPVRFLGFLLAVCILINDIIDRSRCPHRCSGNYQWDTLDRTYTDCGSRKCDIRTYLTHKSLSNPRELHLNFRQLRLDSCGHDFVGDGLG